MLPLEVREELIRRMRRIEGQAQGIQRMLAEDRDCHEVLNQLASVRAATHRASIELTRHYALQCLSNGDPSAAVAHRLAEVMDLLSSVTD